MEQILLNERKVISESEVEIGATIGSTKLGTPYTGGKIPASHHLYTIAEVAKDPDKYAGEVAHQKAFGWPEEEISRYKTIVVREEESEYKPFTLTEFKAAQRLGDKAYETDRGFIAPDFGKYCADLTFVVNSKTYLPKFVRPSNEEIDSMNIRYSGDISVLYGRHYVSTKSNKHCFECLPKDQAPHVLIRVGWGGSFNRSRGLDRDDFPGYLYYRCASSNGGGRGNDYCIIPKNFKRVISVDDI